MDKPRLSTSSTPESPLKASGLVSEHDLQLERQAVRRIDYTILPIITLFYLASYLVCFSNNTAFVSNHPSFRIEPILVTKIRWLLDIKGLMSVYRKCSRCRSPKGSPFNWWSISDLYRHLFRVCRFVKCRKYRSLNNNLGHISLQNPWAVSFSRILVQGCFCQRWSSPGVSWPHVKVRSSESFIPRSFFLSSTLWLYLNVKITCCSRICNIIRRSGHSEGLPWTSWRPPDSRYLSHTFDFLHTEGVISQVRRRTAVLVSTNPPLII